MYNSGGGDKELQEAINMKYTPAKVKTDIIYSKYNKYRKKLKQEGQK